MDLRALAGRLLNVLPYIGGLRQKQIGLIQQIEKINFAQGGFSAGHFYSPIPTRKEVEDHLTVISEQDRELVGVDLNEMVQGEQLRRFESYYREMPFAEEPQPGYRYYFNQGFFCYADAIFLYCFLRHIRPRRIIEVGSGFSSAVILDTVDNFITPPPEITFIEPYPERLQQLLKPGDEACCKIYEKKVQDIPLDYFMALQDGDLLFIDSSHVVKCGSDVQFLMFEVLPRLPAGVFVHFHDIFYSFDYPAEWLRAGWYWNENYFLRAFLTNNSDWEIFFFNSYMGEKNERFLKETMPLCLKNTGASIYLRRINKTKN